MSRKPNAVLCIVAGVVALSVMLAVAWSARPAAALVPLHDEDLAVLLGTECNAGHTAGTDCACGWGTCSGTEGLECQVSTICVELDMETCHKVKVARTFEICNEGTTGFSCDIDYDPQPEGCMDYYTGAKEIGQQCTLAMGDRCTNNEESSCGSPIGTCEDWQP
jgi:hypothetical protein